MPAPMTPRRRMTPLRTLGRLRPLGLALLALVGVNVLAPRAPIASAESTELERYRDKNWKFSFRKYKEWAQVPVETKGAEPRDFSDDCLVARFSEAQGGRTPGIIRIFRMVNGGAGSQPAITAETPPTPSAPTPGAPSAPSAPAAPPAPAAKAKPAPKTPKNMVALLEQYLVERMGLESSPLSKGGEKAFKSKDEVPGRYWLLGVPKGPFLVLAIFEKDGAEIGMFLGCDGQDRKRLEAPFVQWIRSFKWFDDHAEDVESLAQLNGVNLTAKKRREIETGLVDGWEY